jgi:hypothetical protein
MVARKAKGNPAFARVWGGVALVMALLKLKLCPNPSSLSA